MVSGSQSATGQFLPLGEMFSQYMLVDVVQHTGSGQAHMPKTQFDLDSCPVAWSLGAGKSEIHLFLQ